MGAKYSTRMQNTITVVTKDKLLGGREQEVCRTCCVYLNVSVFLLPFVTSTAIDTHNQV